MVSSFPGYSAIQGVDCTAIHEVSDVSCEYGKCVVQKCMPGYSLDKNGDCILEEVYYDDEAPVLVSQMKSSLW
jgi:hypothetical protein